MIQKIHALTIEENEFKLDEKSFKLWGIRTASASISQKLTDHLLGQLDDYKSHGVNMVAVYFMGSSNCAVDPFSADGKQIEKSHLLRMEQIIEACNSREMIVVLGIFYQHVKEKEIRDFEACKDAVKTVAKWLKQKGYRNVILNIANEQSSFGYSNTPWERIKNPEDVILLCSIAKDEHPDIIVGAGGYDHEKNEAIGRSQAVDVLLFDTDGDEYMSGDLYTRFVKAGVKYKPMINMEQFGGWTKRFLPQGDYESVLGKQRHLEDVDSVIGIAALGTTFHSNPWCQGPSIGDFPNRFDLGGTGTKEDPGIRWYFEYIKQKTGR